MLAALSARALFAQGKGLNRILPLQSSAFYGHVLEHACEPTERPKQSKRKAPLEDSVDGAAELLAVEDALSNRKGKRQRAAAVEPKPSPLDEAEGCSDDDQPAPDHSSGGTSSAQSGQEDDPIATGLQDLLTEDGVLPADGRALQSERPGGKPPPQPIGSEHEHHSGDAPAELASGDAPAELAEGEKEGGVDDDTGSSSCSISSGSSSPASSGDGDSDDPPAQGASASIEDDGGGDSQRVPPHNS